jgi:two-component system, chemotaxis family, CheB/CheR fusion protein
MDHDTDARTMNDSSGAPSAEFTIVAIGASAGGLDALRDLFGAAAVDVRIAYVVVTHLPPHHVSYLAELLGRAGALPAHELREGERLQGGQVHVMPPGRLMSLHEGTVRFEHEVPDRSPPPKPIDFFMTSLAEQAGDRSVGIVLSGTDHDGTVGLKAIKDAGGLTLVQTPGTAQFPGMPRSAITAGVADHVLAPHAMPATLANLLGNRPPDVELGAAGEDEAGPEATERLNAVLAVVFERTGNDFRLYRPAMLRRRLRRRMALEGCGRLDDYLALIERSPDEAAALSGEFLIGVTDFFRDPEAWQEFEHSGLPALFAERSADDLPWRVWTPGCSSGEESYSIAMLLQEQLDARGGAGSIQVLGTDIDLDALAVARQGVYPEGIDATVSAPRLARFFERRDGRYAVRKSLREAVMFAPQNLVRDTPFSRLDLVLCRNVLMYFDPALQERVLQLFHFALKPGGLLWLGKAESLDAHGALFEPVSREMRLFRRVGGRSQLPRGYARAGSIAPGWQRRNTDRPEPAAEILRRHLGERRVDAAMLIDRNGRALHFLGSTARFLAPQGDATLEALRLVRPELQPALRTVMRLALGEGKAALRRPTLLDGGPMTLEAEPVRDGDRRGLAVLLFTAEADPAHGGGARALPATPQPPRTGRNRRTTGASWRWRSRMPSTATKTCGWPARSPRRSTRSCSPPTRSSRARAKSCSRSTRSWRRSMLSWKTRSPRWRARRTTWPTCSTARTSRPCCSIRCCRSGASHPPRPRCSTCAPATRGGS